ncbi:MAG: hypothetical protein R3250_16415 [Melioribacteraceae bacterium]|nr:hypothetical protein [Melioribacteraceae bacterium]
MKNQHHDFNTVVAQYLVAIQVLISNLYFNKFGGIGILAMSITMLVLIPQFKLMDNVNVD